MTERAWETLDRQIAYSCEGFDIVTERVDLPNGETTEFDYLAEGESVVILPFTPEGEVVVIDEWRHAVKRDNRGLPAGSVEDGEDLAPAARRELREETGYEAETLERLCSVEPANGFADAYFHYFVAHDCTPAGEQELDANETIDVTTVEFDDLVESIRRDEFEDGRAVTGILYYALFEQ